MVSATNINTTVTNTEAAPNTEAVKNSENVTESNLEGDLPSDDVLRKVFVLDGLPEYWQIAKRLLNEK